MRAEEAAVAEEEEEEVPSPAEEVTRAMAKVAEETQSLGVSANNRSFPRHQLQAPDR